jgi:hypothetical protein
MCGLWPAVIRRGPVNQGMQNRKLAPYLACGIGKLLPVWQEASTEVRAMNGSCVGDKMTLNSKWQRTHPPFCVQVNSNGALVWLVSWMLTVQLVLFLKEFGPSCCCLDSHQPLLFLQG